GWGGGGAGGGPGAARGPGGGAPPRRPPSGGPGRGGGKPTPRHPPSIPPPAGPPNLCAEYATDSASKVGTTRPGACTASTKVGRSCVRASAATSDTGCSTPVSLFAA